MNDSRNEDTDIVIESSDYEGGELSCAERLKELKKKLSEIDRERSEYLSGWQRAKADLINFKKEEEERRKEARHHAERYLIEELLPVLEGYALARQNKGAWESVPEEWRRGVEHLFGKFFSVLSEHGLKEDRPEGKFDPALHEAVGSIPVSEQERDGMIEEVVTPGFLLNGKVLRAARVKVASFEN